MFVEQLHFMVNNEVWASAEGTFDKLPDSNTVRSIFKNYSDYITMVQYFTPIARSIGSTLHRTADARKGIFDFLYRR